MKMERPIHRRFALLMGVDDYDDPSFPSIFQTTHDVMELESVLTEYGYEVRPYNGMHPGDLLWVAEEKTG